MESDAVVSRLEAGPVTDEMNAIPLPLEEELAFVDAAEPDASTAGRGRGGARAPDEPELTEEWVSPEPEQDAGEDARARSGRRVVTEEEAATTDPDEELAPVEAAEPEVRQVDPADEEAGDDEDAGADESVDIVDVVDDLLEQPSAPKSPPLRSASRPPRRGRCECHEGGPHAAARSASIRRFEVESPNSGRPDDRKRGNQRGQPAAGANRRASSGVAHFPARARQLTS